MNEAGFKIAPGTTHVIAMDFITGKTLSELTQDEASAVFLRNPKAGEAFDPEINDGKLLSDTGKMILKKFAFMCVLDASLCDHDRGPNPFTRAPGNIGNLMIQPVATEGSTALGAVFRSMDTTVGASHQLYDTKRLGALSEHVSKMKQGGPEADAYLNRLDETFDASTNAAGGMMIRQMRSVPTEGLKPAVSDVLLLDLLIHSQ